MSNFSCLGAPKSFPFSVQSDIAASLRSRGAGQRASADRIGTARNNHASGPVVRSRHAENPEEIDPRASLNHARDRDIRPRFERICSVRTRLGSAGTKAVVISSGPTGAIRRAARMNARDGFDTRSTTRRSVSRRDWQVVNFLAERFGWRKYVPN
jgi:hypothetical protein